MCKSGLNYRIGANYELKLRLEGVLKTMPHSYWLVNVRMESRFRYEAGIVIGTETELCNLLIEDGRIAKICSASHTPDDGLPQKDAGNLLALPGFIEKHCHLDKTLLGDSWQACRPSKNRIEIFENEKNTLPKLSTTMEDRAKRLIDCMLRCGSTHLRTHVDIYPEVGLEHLVAIRQALSEYDGKLSFEIVAFPQHGLLRSQSQHLVRSALSQGATIVGGVDPAMIDDNIEASLQQMMDLAVEANAAIDLHLHDPGQLGVFTIKRLASIVEDAGWQGKVSISHAYCLGDISPSEAGQIAEMLAALNISLISSVPIGRPMPPIDVMHAKGVKVALGCDNILDLWSPFGSGDILERSSRLAERFLWRDEFRLSRALGFITADKTPLDRDGNRAWPIPGDEANLVLVSASCSAEAVARKSPRRAVLYKGNVIAGSI